MQRSFLHSRAHGEPLAGKINFGGGDGVFAKVKDAGGEHGVGFAFLQNGDHMIQIPRAAAGDDGNGDSFANGPGEGDVVAVFSAVGVHAGEENLTSPATADFGCPGDGVQVRAVAAPVGIDLPGAIAIGTGVDGDHDGLISKGGSPVIDGLGILDRGGIEANLICAGQQKGAHVGDGADAPANGEGHETAGGGALHDIQDGAAPIGRSGDVEEDEFIGPLIVISDSAFHRISGIPKFEEFRAFDNTALVYVKARNDAAGEHEGERMKYEL